MFKILHVKIGIVLTFWPFFASLFPPEHTMNSLFYEQQSFLMFEILISSLFNTLTQKNYTEKTCNAFGNPFVNQHSPKFTMYFLEYGPKTPYNLFISELTA